MNILYLDISENDTDYGIDIDLPGMKKEDIKVSIKGNHLFDFCAFVRSEISRNFQCDALTD